MDYKRRAFIKDLSVPEPPGLRPIYRRMAAAQQATTARKGVFELNDEFYTPSGSIFENMPHDEAMFESKNK